MAELAPGPASGYIYQFELALAILAGLEHLEDTLSIEKIDDVAVQNEDDLVTMTMQSKHSISPNGTTFEDTSKSLWRTLEIWIQKIENKELGTHSKFICATNKTVPTGALVRKIITEPLATLRQLIDTLLEDQKKKLKETQDKNPKNGSTISQTIRWIEYTIEKWEIFSIIKANIEIWDNNSPKDTFLNRIHMAGPEHKEVAKDNIYHTMAGWITISAKAKWMQGEEANFKKLDFENKYSLVRNSPSLVQAVFRKKIDLGSLSSTDIENKKNELFVKQIDEIQRRIEAKQRKIEEAILNFLYHDIEVTHILRKGNITKADFDEFRGKCRKKWETCFDSHVTKEIEEYSDEEKNRLAIRIYDEIMDNIEVSFLEDINFNTDNRYIHNGTFLKLSNIPEIGWHPEWESKYRKNDGQ